MVEAAIDLMRGFGLSGAGINDIVRESAAPKGSVYHFFPGGKLQIAQEALAVYSDRVQAFIADAMARGTTPAQRLRGLFEAFARRASASDFRRSCAVGAVSLDLGDESEPLREQLAGAFDAWIDEIARLLDPKRPAQARPLAAFALTAIEGAYVRSRAERSAQAFVEAGGWLAKLATG